ncbi:hypothetical protein MUK70_07595 [Dyadobacter chenwenxiniae]|uniref:Uncharacterized protein n=1 Tax=Dyadobacter chenwenxiniae TaxID=2906456 RepID=A0A9X1TEE7_9BACT|nr:hypothetical protein [Dyadobacter chenwenxiniae]MCF0062981.1 hypothetical protein [Dyadobacter chenwenxiniae]UON84845.1 hypothetical protein MUK70_07595 [Dyadobacter chenwenxiniae]
MSENPNSYFGKCLLTKVSNFYKDPTKSEAEGIATNGVVEAEKVQVIHYPDCQQLVFHMPKYAYDAGSYQLIDDVTGAIMEDLQVKDRLNGGTMMLIDTLPYKPGSYTIEASWPDGWTHQIRFIKLMEGFSNVESTSIPSNDQLVIKGSEYLLQHSYKPETASIKLPRDPVTGFLAPRSFTSRSIKKQGVSTPAVTYTQDGRGGKIFYRNSEIAIDFDWEFAAGNAVVLFLIPEEKYWEIQTKTPLSRRDEILSFVANQVIKDQAPGCRFEVYSNHITIIR